MFDADPTALKLIPASDEALRKEILFQLATGYAETGDFQQAVDMACELANLDFGYKDIGQKFLNGDGGLERRIMPDFLHLSPAGYDIWADAIKDDVQKLLK